MHHRKKTRVQPELIQTEKFGITQLFSAGRPHANQRLWECEKPSFAN